MQLNKILLIPCLLTAIVFSETLTVPGQYNSIQSAINASNDQDTILVSPGFYQENIDFNGKNIIVTSTYISEQDSLIITSTIIDGNNNGSVVSFDNNETNSAVLQGLPCKMVMGNMQIQMRMVRFTPMVAASTAKGQVQF